ncbi:uncharacterized protein LOC122320916 [Drosophila ficusphila]|uniref:uncharacterized protein LOC122320916 n=1 Tax=Drosophila ficusphila TaxID=30025 RepID=UPI001C8A8737|nr:uncharacterized protein LOC122320916 [Drosophila ficusphila]
MSNDIAIAALARFITVSDRMSNFRATIETPGPSAPSVHTCKVRKEQVRSLWEKAEKEFEACLDTISSITTEGAEEILATLHRKYEYCYSVYEELSVHLSELMDQATPQQSTASTTNQSAYISSGSESGQALKDLQSTIQGCLVALAHSKISTENWDCLLVFLCASRLPKLTLSLWEQSLSSKSDIPTWDEMNTFLGDRYRTLEAIEDMKPSYSNHSTTKSQPVSRRLNSFEAKVVSKPKNCDLCSKENHPVRLCQRFLQMSVDARTNYIKKKQLCLNCFARGHQLRECTSTHSCFTCRARHHTLLHKGNPNSSGSTTGNISSASPQNPTVQRAANASENLPGVQNYFATGARAVLLGTAIIDICHLGTNYRARALIDSGSEATFITERLFNLIKLPFRLIQAQVSGLNKTISAQATRLCHFSIRAPNKPGLQLETAAYVLPELAGTLPSYPIPRDALSDLPAIPLADPTFLESSQIDVLIGADMLPSVLLSGMRTNICGSLLGQETIFGWVLTGPVSSTSSQNRVSAFTTQITETGDRVLEKLLTKFWEVENIPTKRVKDSDSYCENNFLQTTTRDASGRYVVSLPFREPENLGSQLGHSRSSALAQFLRNENRLKRDFPLKEQYDSIIQEYLDLGHMREIPPSYDSPNYYLPHHAVIKPESTTAKLRVVFNASSPSSNGTSLNDILHAGPVLQSDLTIQILKWRYFQYVFSADITKMYRQIWVDPKHTPFQRILFRNKDGEVNDFELKAVTFGVNCAPFLALRVLQQLADDVEKDFPTASNIIRHFMYVDDVLAGTTSIQEARLAISELRHAFSSARFPLRKWTANQKSILEDIPNEHLLHEDFRDLHSESFAKTLGVRWNATSDEFCFVSPPVSIKSTHTKREELGWDENIPTEMDQRWQDFLRSYSELEQIRIPRWVGFQPGVKVEHHGFCDASQKAYGAAIYLRVEVGHNIMTRLLTAKTRGAPVKTVSLPRLELCGALLLSEMIAAVLPNMPISNSDIFCRTDSTIVLAWLSKPACHWTTFVANRVTKITQVTSAEHWAHVRSEHNSADLASRGVSLRELVHSQLWWEGPDWLQQPKDMWPTRELGPPVTDIEQRAVKVNFAKAPSEDFLERFSALDKALRVLAYVIRFTQRCRKMPRDAAERPTKEEVQKAERVLIRNAQRGEYTQELKVLNDKRSIPVSSPIANLFPFLDQQGLLRACGRITASTALQYDEHPIILPYNCRLARLLVLFSHQISLHGGNQLVVRLIRSKYWIPKIKNLVKAVLNSCKAIHLEPTSDLTTEKFLATFARFVARRGCPQRVHSDNGKTFVGAATLLSRDFMQTIKESVAGTYSHQGLVWRFIPPGAPHMGGLWEAGVKSFKALFYKSTSSRKPLSPMSENPSELLALTPGHFLIGGPLLSTAEPEIKGDAQSIINRWQHLKALHQQFSARWKEEYLKELHKRNKWQTPSRDIQVDDMVVVKEDNMPSNEWRLGRVVSVLPGADSRVRVVEIRTARGTITRPIHKLVLLPMEDQATSAFPK